MADVLDAAVVAARSRYAARRPRSAEWAQRATAVLPGGHTRTVLHFDPFPFRVASATRATLADVDGHDYVDLLGNYTAGLLGHSPPPVRAAVDAALDRGWSLGATHPAEVELAELVVRRFPSIEQVRFTNSGTEANLMALAAATHHTRRRRIVVFEGGYHGGVLTFGAHATGTAVSPVTIPHDWIVLPYNDHDALLEAFARSGDEIAAVLVEPLQGSAGCIPADLDWLRLVRTSSRRAGALLVFDEVMTSRLAVGGAQVAFGVLPDLTTLGKYVAGGFSFGAFGGRADVMAHFGPGGQLGHAGTFNNNVVSMAAGVATLGEVLTPDVIVDANGRGERLRAQLAVTLARAGVPMSVTGAGSLMNIHPTPGPVHSVNDLATADDRWRELLFFAALEAGFFFARRGFIALSIEITDADAEHFAEFVAQWAADAAPLARR